MPEECWKVQKPKHCNYQNQDEDNSLNKSMCNDHRVFPTKNYIESEGIVYFRAYRVFKNLDKDSVKGRRHNLEVPVQKIMNIPELKVSLFQ